MYNASSIEKFIDKVHAEAMEAAQAIYDKHYPELKSRILAQLKPGDKLSTGMGLASIRNKKDEYVGDKLERVLTNLEYWDKCKAGFQTEDLTK